MNEQITEDRIMAWSKPILNQVECGMEVNMYAPEEDDAVLF